jgi:hypothetical protein
MPLFILQNSNAWIVNKCTFKILKISNELNYTCANAHALVTSNIKYLNLFMGGENV